jgi:TrmH family RNA methyltransferase
MVKKITSTNNPFIQEIVQLGEKSKYRRSQSAFVVEGRKEIRMAVTGKYEVQKIIYNPEIIDFHSVQQLFGDKHGAEIIEVNNQVYQKIAYRENTEGIIAVFGTRAHDLTNLNLSDKASLILVAVSPEKPGNIGALLRTAEAAGVDALIIADPLTDLYNPNIIRASLGTLFTCNIATGTSIEVVTFLKNNQIQLYCAAIAEKATNCYTEDFTSGTAIVVGPESEGLNAFWLAEADHCVQIPMHGQADSLNVSVSAAILIFEAVRQRKYNNLPAGLDRSAVNK